MSETLKTRRTCPDCGATMRLMAWQGLTRPIALVEPNARRSWVTGLAPVVGFLAPWLCPRCHRVLLYAVPAEPSSEVVPGQEPEGRGDEVAPGGNGGQGG